MKNLKKVMAISLTIFCLLLSACSNDKDNNNDPSNSASSQGSSQGNNDPATSKPEENSKFTKTIKVPDKKIYINYPNSYGYKSTSHTDIAHPSKDFLVGVTFDTEKVFNNSDKIEIVKMLENKFLSNISLSTSGSIKEQNINIKDKENKIVNSYDAVKFTGSIQNSYGDGWECYVYGYAFVAEGVPCAVIGVVSAKDQKQEQIKEVTETVDEMMKTLRDTK